jgi:hypothetical protein
VLDGCQKGGDISFTHSRDRRQTALYCGIVPRVRPKRLHESDQSAHRSRGRDKRPNESWLFVWYVVIP